MLYQLPSLPHGYDALQPHIDALTMKLHHTRHHAACVGNLNKLLESREKLLTMSLEEILFDIRVVPLPIRQAVRNFGGAHLNHSLFWHIMGPGQGGVPKGTFGKVLNDTFGDFYTFRQTFTRTAMDRFGSGWAWLGVDAHNNNLEVLSTPNEDSPIMYGFRPVLGLDLWEHAYYLTYQNRKADYIEAWWNVVNWQRVGELYLHCTEMSRSNHPAQP